MELDPAVSDEHYHETPDLGEDGYTNVSAGWVLHTLVQSKVAGTHEAQAQAEGPEREDGEALPPQAAAS